MRWVFFSRVLPESSSSAAGVRLKELLASAFRAGAAQVTFATCAKAKPVELSELESLSVQFAQVSTNDRQGLRDLLDRTQPHIAVFDTFVSEELFSHGVQEHSPNCMRVLDLQDIHSVRLLRERLYQSTSIEDTMISMPKATDNSIPLARELASVFRSDAVLVCGADDLRVMERQFKIPVHKMFNAPLLFGEAGSDVVRTRRGFPVRRNFVSIGNFRHNPNRDSVHWMANEIWPRIRLELPNAELHVFGAYADKESGELTDASKGFFVRGKMKELKTLGKYRVMLCPLRFGSGIKGKIIDAWSYGVPVVSTPVGMENTSPLGVHAWGGRGCGTTVDEIVRDAIALYTEEDMWNRAQRLGAEILRESFEREQGQKEVVEFLMHRHETFLEDRESDYIMAVLQDSRSRATDYMSKYLELKRSSEGRE